MRQLTFQPGRPSSGPLLPFEFRCKTSALQRVAMVRPTAKRFAAQPFSSDDPFRNGRFSASFIVGQKSE